MEGGLSDLYNSPYGGNVWFVPDKKKKKKENSRASS